MSERDQLMRLFQKLGADERQAGVLAEQTIKRCDQLVAARGLSRMEAMAHLLQLVTKGSQGVAPPGFEGVGKPPSPGV
ncbi:MAG: hypothetical protein ABII82_05720 [Verrucomicrobiota bacterium]